ncbi:hypothetical protein Trydic_g18602 [Trypoxylus dichotomus]
MYYHLQETLFTLLAFSLTSEGRDKLLYEKRSLIRICGEIPGTVISISCLGVLISPRLILTKYECISINRYTIEYVLGGADKMDCTNGERRNFTFSTDVRVLHARKRSGDIGLAVISVQEPFETVKPTVLLPKGTEVSSCVTFCSHKIVYVNEHIVENFVDETVRKVATSLCPSEEIIDFRLNIVQCLNESIVENPNKICALPSLDYFYSLPVVYFAPVFCWGRLYAFTDALSVRDGLIFERVSPLLYQIERLIRQDNLKRKD